MIPSIDELQAAFTHLTATNSQPQFGGATSSPASVMQGVAVSPATSTPPTGPVQITDPRMKGYHLDVTVASGQVVAAAELVDRYGFALDTVTGVDWMAEGQMEVVYDFFHPASPLHVVIRTRVPRDKAELPTILGVYAGANWHERETHDFFGIRFLGHPDLSPLLLPEDADFHPLRKDYPGAA